MKPRAGSEGVDRSRMQQLLEISKLLLRFEGLEETFDSALAIAAEAIPLGSAIVIAPAEGQQQMIVWPRPDRTSAEMAAAKAHLKAAHAYLIGGAPAEAALVSERAGRTSLPRSTAAGLGVDGPRYIVMPLVVQGGAVFGSLQLEGLTRLDRSDLAFMSAIASQLAIALDRQATLLQHLSFARALAASLGEGVVAVDRQGQIVFVNPTAAELLGCPAEAARGRRLREIVGMENSEGGSPECPLERVLRTGQALRSDGYLWFRRDGRSFPVGVSGTVLRNGEVATGAVLAFQDISARKQVETALLQAARGRERFLEIVTHDLKSPLMAIMTSTGTLLADAPPPQDGLLKQRARIEVIDRSARRMGRLINDLADFASLEAGRIPWQSQTLDPGPLAREAMAGFAALAEQRQLALEVEITGELCYLEGDRDRLLQVLENLIGNATKVTPAGGSIVLHVDKRGRDVLFTLSDTGPGIPREDLPSIFDRYRRGSNPGYPGTGLGLAIAGAIVRAHRGKIWVESTPGAGTTFFFTIPAATTRTDLLATSRPQARFPS